MLMHTNACIFTCYLKSVKLSCIFKNYHLCYSSFSPWHTTKEEGEEGMDNLNNIKAALPSKRTLLVVDGAYLMISAQKIHLKINYMKLVNELERILGCEVCLHYIQFAPLV